MASTPAYIAFTLILAAVLDFLVMVWLRRAYQQRKEVKTEGSVYILGTYSPALSWLKGLFRPGSVQEIQPELEPPESTAVQEAASAVNEAGAAPPMESGEQFVAPTGTQEDERKSIWRGHWLEWVIIFVAVTLFCAGILDLSAPTRLPGNEAEVFQMLDWTLVNSLKNYHAFPMWNIYIQTGIPYVADPMLHVFNPVVTLPVLLYGVRAGFKLGIYFSFLIAAFGMWRLAATLGMGRATRIWMALMFAFAGQPVARFFQGQYLFVLGFAYIPWIVSSLFLVTQRRCRRDIAVAVASLALLFFSGNAYYAFYTLMVVGLFGLVMLLRFKRRPFSINLDIRHTLTFLVIGILAVGVIAIQLLPTAEFWPRLSKDLNLAGEQTVRQIFLDYTSKDSYRPDAYSVLPAREEFYAYIGLTPFLGLALLPLALWKRNRRALIFFVLIVLLTVGWITLDSMPWRDIFLRTRQFIQFRHLLRILVFGSFALVSLAGIGLDTLWKSFEEGLEHTGEGQLKTFRTLTYAGFVVLGAFMLFGVVDLFDTNQAAVRTQAIYQPANGVMGWVRQNDLSDYYVRHNPTNAWQDATISNNLRYIEVWYHFADIRSMEGKINERYVKAQPIYLTQSPSEPIPDGVELIAMVNDYNVFKLPESLPMAFLVSNAELQQGGDAGPLLYSDVTPLSPFLSSPNDVELIAEGQADQRLVVLMTNYPGWQVKVDGRPQTLENVSGYMAVEVQAGVHKYTFSYRPRSFFIGLIISLVASGVTVYLLLSDPIFSRQAVRQRLQAWTDWLKRLREKLTGGWEQLRPVTGEATYLDGALHPAIPFELAEETHVRVTVEAQTGLTAGRAAWRRWQWATADLAGTIWRAIPLETTLFTVAIGLYLSTRLIGLANFPIYFFTDEAVQTVMAEDFLHNGLRNYNDELLPTYFNKDATYNLSSVSVYLQVIPLLIFGKSVFVTRAVSVLVATLGAVAVGLILRDIFKLRYWWSGVLLLSIAPAWFLHSRTAFETVEMVSFYAGFLYFYLRYRYISPKALYPALVLGALVFYTYSPGQLIIVVTGVFLLFSDLRYHWRNRRTALKGLLLLMVLVLPYMRYSLAHPEALMQHLTTRAPIWMQNIPLSEKLGQFFKNYLLGLSPSYWFFPNQRDLARHLMKGYGHLLLITLPFFLLGLGIVLAKLRSSANRAVLFAMLAAPTGSALVAVGITRILVFIIPAVLMMTLGLAQALVWLERGVTFLIKRRGVHEPGRWVYIVISLVMVVVLCTGNIAMLRDALVNGPTWYQDYTLAGMQYGASQLFKAVNEYVQQHPGVELMVSPSWTNGADAVASFFLPQGSPVRMGSIEGHLFQHLPLNEDMVFVMIPVEMEKVLSSGKFKDVQVDEVLTYPNGEPGFYFVHLKYVDNIDEILSAEQEVRRALQEATVMIDGEAVQVRYSMLDMGVIDQAFDGNPQTLLRTLEANPFVIELTFPEPRQFNGYSIVLGSADVRVTTQLYPASGGQPVESVASFDGSVSNPELRVDFEQTVTAQVVRFEILEPYAGEPANVHVWEITLR